MKSAYQFVVLHQLNDVTKSEYPGGSGSQNIGRDTFLGSLWIYRLSLSESLGADDIDEEEKLVLLQ